MKNNAVRIIMLIAAGSVFLFSGMKVFNYRLELHNGAEYAQTIAQMVVSENSHQSTSMAAEYESDMASALESLKSDASAGEETSGSELRPAEEKTSHSSLQSMDGEPGISSATSAVTPEDQSIDAAAESISFKDNGASINESSSDQTLHKGSAGVKSSRTAPIQVDFDALLAKNEDVVAWLYSPDTPINYPVVQAEDNEYYMHRLLDGSRNYAGTLFMDFRNASDFSDWNTVIYGHNMRNDSMFGTLTDYKMQSYAQAHSEIFLLTPDHDYVIKVLGGLVTTEKSDLYNALRPDDARKVHLLKDWLKAEDLENFAVTDRVVTLSTCSYESDSARYVVIGVLEELAS